MNTPGRTKDRTPASLKEAYSHLVDACGGDVAAGNLAQKSKSQIQRYTDEAEPDVHMPVTVALALEASCGNPFVTRFMALATNHILLNTTTKDDAPLAQDLAAVGREMALLFEEFGASLSDGKIDGPEAAKIEARAMAGISALASVISETRRITKGGA